jgi:uncharacterized protein YidB (DUF937 family)
MIVNVSDFVGKYELHRGQYDSPIIQDYIDIYEKRYLIELFGSELFDQFFADLDNSNVPQSPNFQFVFNPFYENVFLHNIIQSEGIKQMLKGFIYFEYLKDKTDQITPNGMVVPSNENSTTASTIYSMMYARYNEAIRTFRAIQTHIAINTNQPTGQIVAFTLINSGSGYVDGTIGTTSIGNGSGSMFDIVTNSGAIDLITIADSGTKYAVGDVLTLIGGNGDAQLAVDYVGTGTFSKFRGVCKQFVYWI